MSVSILILTWNEEHNLPRCLDAVAWSDDVLVVDSYSGDATTEIARQRGARVLQRKFDDFAKQRNYGLEQGGLKYEWVLHLDADEIVSSDLQDEILSSTSGTQFQAFRLPSKLIFRGRWLRFAGMYPAYQVRLGRRDKLRFKMAGHGQRETLPSHKIGTLKSAFLHYSFSKGLDDWFERHNRYSSAEAHGYLETLAIGQPEWRDLFSSDLTERRRALKELSMHLPCRSVWRFLYMYILHLGFLDGQAGFQYCRLLSLYESMIDLKMKELLRVHRALSL